MQTPDRAILKSLIAVAALALASLPVSAQRITADAVRKGPFPQALRGQHDASPDKSVHYFSKPAGHSPAILAGGSNPAVPVVSSFFAPSSRSGSVNYGFLSGPNPFSGPEGSKAAIKTYVVPLVIKVHQVATDFGVDSNGFLILTGIKNQDMTYDPTQAAPACLGPTNNVPSTLAYQSPVFQNNQWVLNGVDLGNTTYEEAFMRANFWNATGKDPGTYHLRLDAQPLPPLVIDFPIGTGIGLPQNSSFFGYSLCAPSVLVDLNYYDEYLDYVAIPQMASEGVNASTFPMFIGGNVLWGAVIGQLPYYEAEAAGYHSTSSVDPALAYGNTQFGDDNFFNWPDAEPLSHEVGEWLNDPTGANYVQSYDVNAVNSPGQTSCQGNYEVGDILSGNYMPPVTGKNGYTYTLQELAYFSYFYGGPSFAAGGAYSTNGTLTSDAGPVCF